MKNWARTWMSDHRLSTERLILNARVCRGCCRPLKVRSAPRRDQIRVNCIFNLLKTDLAPYVSRRSDVRSGSRGVEARTHEEFRELLTRVKDPALHGGLRNAYYPA